MDPKCLALALIAVMTVLLIARALRREQFDATVRPISGELGAARYLDHYYGPLASESDPGFFYVDGTYRAITPTFAATNYRDSCVKKCDKSGPRFSERDFASMLGQNYDE